MFRRSSSHSNIPVSLFGPRTGGKEAPTRQRSNSTGRLSQQKESSVGKFAGNPLERKSKLSLPKTTPLSLGKRRYTATPSSSSRSSRVSPASGLKVKKSIQSLSTNSVWVNQQYKKVQKFISESGLFDPTVVNPNNIKPPSIKGFIYLVTTLLDQIYPKLKIINQENYKEEIVKKLKTLLYPGTMTNSTLKSVNTMHSWPQVIGMCGWLVDKIELTKTGRIDDSTVPMEEKHKYLLPELTNQYVFQRCNIFNNENKSTEIEQAEQQYKQDFMNILCFDPNEYLQLESEHKQLEEKKQMLQKDIDNLLPEREAVKSYKDQVIDDLAILEATDADEQAELEAEITHFNSLSDKLALKKNELKRKIKKLNEGKRNQPCSYQEKEELLLKCQRLKNEINLINGRINHAQEIKNKFDDNMNEEHLKLESKVIQWNRSLMEACIKNANLKKLLLKETGFHNDQFLEEIRKIAKMKQDIEIDLTRKIETMEVTHKQKKNDLQNIKNELENLQDEINKFVLETKQFDQNKAALDEDTKQRLYDWKVLKQDTLLSVDDCPEVRQIKQLTEENETLKITAINKKMEVKNFAEEAKAFLIGLDKCVDNTLENLNSIFIARRKQIEELIKKKIDDGESFIKFLERELQEQ